MGQRYHKLIVFVVFYCAIGRHLDSLQSHNMLLCPEDRPPAVDTPSTVIRGPVASTTHADSAFTRLSYDRGSPGRAGTRGAPAGGGRPSPVGEARRGHGRASPVQSRHPGGRNRGTGAGPGGVAPGRCGHRHTAPTYGDRAWPPGRLTRPGRRGTDDARVRTGRQWPFTAGTA